MRYGLRHDEGGEVPEHELRAYDPGRQPYISFIGLNRPGLDETRYPQHGGYDLGVSGDPIALPPNMQARGFRQERLLNSHEGADAFESAYNPRLRGFRYPQRFNGV